MIIAKEAKTEQEKQEVFKALPKLKPREAFYIYGYWKGTICVGATWLDITYPHRLNMELTDKSFGLLKAIAKSYQELFKKFKVLTSNIPVNNFPSNKIARHLGWRLVYTQNNMNIYEITKELWNYKDKYPLE